MTKPIGVGVPLLILACVAGIVLFTVSPTLSGLGLASAAVVLASCWFMHRVAGLFNLRSISIPAFSFLVYMAVIAIPALVVYGDQIEPYRSQYLVSVQSVLITMPLGIWITGKVVGFKREESTNFFRQPPASERLGLESVTIFVLLFAVAGALALSHISEVRTIPLAHLLKNPGDYFVIMELREDAVKLLSSRWKYGYAMVMAMGYPFLILLSLGYYLQSRRARWLILFFLTFVVGTLYSAMTTAKGPVTAILMLIFLLLYLWRGGHFGAETVILGPLLFFAFPAFVLLTATAGMGFNVWYNLQSLVDRVFYTPASVLYYYFEVVPSMIPYQHGATIGKLAMLMGWRTLNIPNIVGLYMNPRAGTGTANAAFVANLHVDFGLAGVLLGGLLAGILMQMAQTYLVRRPKTALNLAVYAFVMFRFSFLSLTSLPVVLLSEGIIPVFFLAWLIRVAEKVPKKRGRESLDSLALRPAHADSARAAPLSGHVHGG